ncbi:hypothetical protein JCM21714_1408 [Gracilibacillus boraciitolerans JCM 21714]|uniref:Endospore appendages core domain-containing protein n=1 Tax=Gracilibacillus boraciitolerans JCM 21714 TaxID=1298598 RepID=W4VGZ4_9BACI|nr:S-Ena type endospore appendage [Gracilibacillus boraciitolerans]GAE92411.1 hypothetical protein JCM21714_1408 [Gracilibacillus boraciitolerans JCM 21714]
MDDQEKWCITTQQVYDWITLPPLTIHRSVRLPYPQRRARDEVCGNFSELTEEFTTLWETDVENVSGTVTLSLVTGTLDDIILSINGGIVVTGNRQIFTKFFPSLSSIEIRSKSEAPVTAGRYCLELEYSLDMEEEGSNWSEDSITGGLLFFRPVRNPPLGSRFNCELR